MEKKEEKTVLAGASNYVLAAKGEKLFVRAGDSWGVISAAPDQKIEKPIDRSGLVAWIDPREEWHQMLVDCWRIFRDFFYDEKMHGLDWPAIRERYLGALAFATSREDLQFLLSEMMSELNVGHAYNPAPPKGLELPPPGPTAGLLGCDWKLENGQYRVSRVLGGGTYDADARSPLALPGVGVHAGDFLLAVNGVPVDPHQDVYAAFLGTAEKPTQITVNENPVLDGKQRVVLVKPLSSESELRYRTWVADERVLVDERSGGRIGYVHVPDTGIHGQNELVRQFMSQMRKEALIVDERWNGGGQIPSRFIELLDRPITNYWAVRHGATWVWPPVGHRGPKAMLINHSSGSGGDCFPYYFRQKGLGKLIGTRTWGGLVGISGNPGLIDGASPTVPTFGFFELDGTWGVEGYGVAPDIEVIDDPSKMQHGEDPQLETAIGHLLAELAAHPSHEVARPPSPDRRRAGSREEDH
jgi:tricorn protease